MLGSWEKPLGSMRKSTFTNPNHKFARPSWSFSLSFAFFKIGSSGQNIALQEALVLAFDRLLDSEISSVRY